MTEATSLAPTTNLAALRSDYDAIQQHKADVDERYKAKFAELQAQIQQLEKQWRESNAELVDEWHHVGAEANAVETALRSAIVATYRESGQKQLGHGLSVRVGAKFVYDEAAAIEWAATNAPICVKRVIDKKAFEAICKTSQPEFVRVEETPVAVIGK